MKSSLVLAALFLLPCSISLAQPGRFTLTGENGGQGDFFGWSVAPAGDVNGDQIPDLIVGAPTYDGVAGFAGKAYLFYGPFTADRSAANADATIRAQTFGDNLGISVAAAGDVNNDGFDDLIIGARSNDAPGVQAGRAYLLLGPVSGNLTDAQAHATVSGSEFEELGFSVASADLNDDGFSDLVLGAYRWSAAGFGRAYVFYGPVSGHHASASADAIITGEFANDDLGTSVASAGDFNGDGTDDLIVGAPHFPIEVTDPGRAYIFFGPISGSMSAGAADIILHGEVDNDQFGSSVASAGDVNGDGVGDVVVGAEQSLNSGPGKAYLYFGVVVRAEGLLVPDAVFTGEQSLDSFGHSVASAGDLNSDGYDDVVVGAWNNSGAGRAYVFAGRPILGAIPATAANLIISGESPGDRFGQSVATGGDLNGDGHSDLFVGAPQDLDGDPGMAHIYLNEILVSVFDNPRSPLARHRITRNVPNPFAISTAIHYDMPNEGRARLAIYDVRGRVVRTLVDGQNPAGTNVVIWDGRDDVGRLSPSGIYFCRLEADGFIEARRVALLR
jgi:hypothetical protein